MLLLVVLVFLLSLSTVQTALAKHLTDYVNNSYGSDIQIEKVDISSLGKIKLVHVLIKDHHGDSLIYIENARTSVSHIPSLFKNKFVLGLTSLENGFLNMKTYKDEKTNNLTVFSQLFDDGKETKGAEFNLTSPKIKLENINYVLFDQNKGIAPIVYYYGISGDLNDFAIKGSEVKAQIRSVSIDKNHLLKILDFNSDFKYTDMQMEFWHTNLTSENSFIDADIVMTYGEHDLADFNERVKINAIFKKSSMALVDLNQIYSEFGTKDIIYFSSQFVGTINDFLVNDLDLRTERKSVLKGDFVFKDIMDTEEYFIDGNIEKLSSSYLNLRILLPRLIGKNLPESFSEVGTFEVSGNIALSKNTINLNIDSNSGLGKLSTDLYLTDYQVIDKAKYKGTVVLQDFRLGTYLKDPRVGRTSLQGKFDGQGFSLNSVNTSIIGSISKHEYMGYTYQHIDVNGVLRNLNFQGELVVNDPNVQMNFSGLADLSKKIYHFDFQADVAYIDLKPLHLFEKYEKSIVKGKVNINLTGNTIETLDGEINFQEASFSNENDDYFFKDFHILAEIGDTVRTISVNSPDIIEGRIIGNFKYGDLLNITKNSLGSLYANYKRVKVAPGQYLDVYFNIYNKILEIYNPELELGSNTFIRGKINSDDDDINLLLKSSHARVYTNEFDNVKLQINSKSPLYNAILSIDNIRTKYYEASNFNLVNVTLNDTLFMHTDFMGGKEKTEKYDLSIYHTINKSGHSVVGFKKSEIVYKDNVWFINELDDSLNKLVFDKDFKNFAIDKISVDSQGQNIGISGAMSGITQNIDLEFKNVELNAISPPIDSLRLDGKLNGKVSLQKKNEKYIPIADLSINYFSINGDFYGDFSMVAEGNENLSNYAFDAALVNGDLIAAEIKGNVDFEQKTPTILASVQLNKFKLNAFSPLGGIVLSNLRGIASGSVNVFGNLYNPVFDGEILLHDAGLKVPYLNVDYDFADYSKILLYDQTFDFQSIDITDTEMGTKGLVGGKIKHENFEKWFMDIFISSENLLVLNTEEYEDALYYGTGVIKGETTIYGPVDNLFVDVQATTNKGTQFIIPLSDVSSVGQSNLIHFVNPFEEELEDEYKKLVLMQQMKGLNLSFNLNVTKDAMAEVVIDKETGSILRGRGDGNLRLGIDMNGKFEMYGELLIDSGEYLFKSIVSKNFLVQQGGTIIWNGDPMDASINITAIHKTKANPAVILDELSSSRKIDVNLITQISGTLSEALLDFDIEIPQASSMVASELEFKLSSPDDKLTQFFSLLATGSFLNTDSRKGEFSGSSVVAGTMAEQASAILTNVLGTETDNFEIGLDYEVAAQNKVENVNTDDQLGIMVSGRIGNKVIVNGKVGVPVGPNTQSSVVGEVEVMLPLNEAETFMGKVYNRQNEIQFDIIDSEGYTQGAGISYRFDFANAREFSEKVGLRKTVEEKLMTKEQKDSIRSAQKLLKKKESEEKKKMKNLQ